jgi:hypothetical protein
MVYTQQTNNDSTYDNSGVLQYFNSVYDNLSVINNENLINENTAKYNIYNYKKIKMYNHILYIIIITCIIVIILTFLRKQFKYFDDSAYLLLVAITIGLSVCYIIYIIWDLLFRDNINFDEYDFSRYGSAKVVSSDPAPYKDYTDVSGAKCKNKKSGTLF